MKDYKIGQLGLLEKTLIEFRNKGISNLEEIRDYLSKKYNLNVTKALLRKRLDSLNVN